MDGVLTIVDESVSAPENFADAPMPDDRSSDSTGSPVPMDHQPQDGPATSDSSHSDDTGYEITPMRVVEAILFAADSPLPPSKIASVLGVGNANDVRKHIAVLNAGYEFAGNAFRIEEVAGGFQMMTLPTYNRWLTKLLRARQETKLTGAAMETLSIVAYKQPCTRADIEAIRGVAAGDLLNRLREMNMVKIVGRAEDLGRPLLYGTTKRFLEVFGLAGLEDLPQVDALQMGAGAADKNEEPIRILPYEGDAEVNAGTPTSSVAIKGEAEERPAITIAESDDFENNSTATDETELPIEASADLHPAGETSLQHPPPKAVVTKRAKRSRKKADPAAPDLGGDDIPPSSDAG